MVVAFMASNANRLALALLLVALGSTLPGGPSARAASLQVSPLVAEVPADTRIVTYRLHNSAAQPLSVEVRAYDWEQPNGSDKLTPAKNLMVVPTIVSIQPGREQLIRVALQGERPDRELSYRLHFQELPRQKKPGKAAITTLLKLNLPLFFTADAAVRSYEPQLRLQDQDTLEVDIKNTGSRYLRVTEMQLKSADGTTLGERKGLFYILPGVTRQWDVPLNPAGGEHAGPYRLKLTTDDGNAQHQLSIE